MNTIVTSDVHIGLKYLKVELFKAFLAGIPDGTELVLNGDTMDRRRKNLAPNHQAVLDLIRKESFKRRVVWVKGNHDERYELDDPGRIEVVNDYSIGKRFYISHGYDFDNITPYNKPLIFVLRLIHELRIRLGAESVHVAYVAKKYRFLYGILRKHVMMNAVVHAKENGFEAVVCGHTHFMDDVVIDGIRYFNTGTWTEEPAYYLLIDDESASLVPFSRSRQ